MGLVYHFGTPLHNAVVLDRDHAALKGMIAGETWNLWREFVERVMTCVPTRNKCVPTKLRNAGVG